MTEPHRLWWVLLRVPAYALQLAQQLRYGDRPPKDSRQIYRGMEIGTDAPTPSERICASPFWRSVVRWTVRYSASQYAEDASQLVEERLR